MPFSSWAEFNWAANLGQGLTQSVNRYEISRRKRAWGKVEKFDIRLLR